MSEHTDHELRSRVEALRIADEREAPDFHDVRDRARRAATNRDRVVRRWPSRIAVSLALAAAIVLAVGVVRVSRRSEFVPPPLPGWTSPTASLLRTPGSELLSSPTLLSSMLDPLTSTSVSRTGRKQ